MVVWKVVGGAQKGGIIVREAQELKSPQLELCLSTGAIVEELDLAGDRLHYNLLSGSGPQTGWVSTRVGVRDLLTLQGRCGVSQEKPFVVVCSHVMVRALPSTTAKVNGNLRKGDRVSGIPFKLRGVPWLLLSSRSWVLIDATSTELGLGELLRPVSRVATSATVGRETAGAEVDFKICSLAGELCSLSVDCRCSLPDLKVAIEALVGIPSREQRLLSGATELISAASLQRFLGLRGEVELSLVRRPAEQALWIEKVMGDWRSLVQAPEHMRADREVVFAAVKLKGEALKHAHPNLRADRDLVLAAVAQDGCALKHVDEPLRGDPAVLSTALRSNGCALKHAPADVQADPVVVSEAVRRDWRALHFAAPSCQSNPEVVLEAIRQDPAALDIVGEDAWADRRVMAAAMRLSGHAVTCPRWHPLRRLATRYTDVECNECNRTIGGDSCLCCRRCDYDICDRCAARVGKVLLEDFGEG